MSLKAVLFERELLILHGSWTDSLCQLLLGLYKYQTAAIDLGAVLPRDRRSCPEDGRGTVCGENPEGGGESFCRENPEGGGESFCRENPEGGRTDYFRSCLERHLQKLGLTFSDCLMLADCAETLKLAQTCEIAVLGYVMPEMAKSGASFVKDLSMIVEGFEEVDFYFLERVYQRFHHLPWTVIETERCCLREITLEDLDDLYRLYEPEEMTRYMEGLYEDRKKEEEYTKAYIEKMYSFYGYGLWVVVEKASGRIIGRAGLGNLEVDGEIQLELGYLIAREKQRQGLAYEVCQGILDYAREATEFRTIHCLIQEQNKASIGLAEKLGFCWEKNVICNEKEMQRYSKILQT